MIDPPSVALMLMREALTLLDRPESALSAQHLRLAIEAAELTEHDADRSPSTIVDDEA